MIPEGVYAISFDAGGTLISPRRPVGHVYAEVAQRHGWKVAPERLDENFHAAWKSKERFDFSKEAWAGIVARTFEGLVDQPDDPFFFESVYSRFASPEVWEIHPDVLLTVEALAQQGYKLLVTSNWDHRLPGLLDGLGLSHFFQAIVFSADAGATKPHRKIFQHAAERMRLSPEQILHVGDTPGEDVEGARASGWHAVLIDRRQRTTGDHVIHSLLDLVAADQMPALRID